MIHPTAVIDHEPIRSKALARPIEDMPACHIHESADVGPFAVIYRGVIVGEYSLVGDHASVREGTKVGAYTIIGRFSAIGYNVTIGNRVHVMDFSHIVGGAVIGDETFVGMNVTMTNDDNPVVGVWKGNSPPIIGRRCQIGSGAIIRAGVHIGDGAIVGMGAVVVRDVPAGATVKGIPAR